MNHSDLSLYLQRIQYSGSTNPESHFTQDLTMAIANADGSRASIKNTLLTIRQKNGEKTEQELANKAELYQAMQRYFGICLS